jgi:hypothetical protein
MPRPSSCRPIHALVVLALAASLAACGGGVPVTQTTATASSPPPANRAPTISGNGAATLTVGQAYNFTPTASDPDGNALTYTISGRPAWATFNATTGALGGTPASGNVGTSNVTITVSDGSLTASLSFTITVNASTTPPANRAPTISGASSATVSVGQAFSFTPTASDPDGNALTFSITGRPAWLSFNASTGALSGTPAAADVASYSMTITVSDGSLTASLPITVTVVAIATGSATLSWTPPTTRTDGSTLTNLAGYRVYYGTSASALTSQANVTNPSLSTLVISNLAAGTWYFAMTSLDAAGVESSRTNTVSLVVR